MVIESYGKPFSVKELDIPTLKDEGDVLIKVESAPLNPSDLGFL